MAPAMDDASEPVAILGAGAVGVFLGAHLAAGGTPILFLARGDARRRAEWHLVHAGSGARRDLVATVEPAGAALPASAQVLVCVRGEQLDEALDRAVAAAPGAAFG